MGIKRLDRCRVKGSKNGSIRINSLVYCEVKYKALAGKSALVRAMNGGLFGREIQKVEIIRKKLKNKNGTNVEMSHRKI